MQDLNDLYFFAKVVEHRGFAPAGRALGVPKSKLSRRIAALEERLGLRLMQRSTRRFSVSEIGQVYYQHCRAMLVEAEAAQEAIELTRSGPSGIVRVTCPINLLQERVSEMLAEFMAQHAGVTLHLEATNRRVDVVGEGVDVAIRARPPPLEDSDLILRVLAERKWLLVGSPKLFAARPPPAVPADLHGLPSLDFGPPHREHAWQLTRHDGQTASIRHHPRLITDDMVALRAAAVAGVGIVELPALMLSDEIRQGVLIRLTPDWVSNPGVIHVVYPSRRGLLPAVRALIDFLSDRFKALAED